MSQTGAERLLRPPLSPNWTGLRQSRIQHEIDADLSQGRSAPSERSVPATDARGRVSYALYTADCNVLLRDTGRTARLIVTPNLDHLRILYRSLAFRHAYASADIILNDSRFLDLLALRGAALCMPGADLAPSMLECLLPNASVFVIGATSAVRDVLTHTYPHLSLSFIQPSMGYIYSVPERRDIATQVLRAQPDVVFICTGAPQRELLGAQLKRAGCRAAILCCGGALQILTHVKRRAPRVFRYLGAEWAWRFINEPHTRKRYAADSLYLTRQLKRFLQLRRTGVAHFDRFDLRTRI